MKQNQNRIKKKRALQSGLVYFVCLILFAYGGYLAFWKGKDDYIATRIDISNAKNLLEELEKWETLAMYDVSEVEVKVEVEVSLESQEETAYTKSEAQTKPSTEPVTSPKTSFEEELKKRNIIVEHPEQAKGYIEFLLHFPEIHLTRGVYTGTTWDEIHYDLNELYLLTVCAEETSIHNTTIGQTAICIQGHNSLRKDLAMNRLLEARVGQSFELIDHTGIYRYTVTAVYAMNRAQSHKKLMENTKALDRTKCYLITCGRNTGQYSFRYQNMICEGTLTNIVLFK